MVRRGAFSSGTSPLRVFTGSPLCRCKRGPWGASPAEFFGKQRILLGNASLTHSRGAIASSTERIGRRFHRNSPPLDLVRAESTIFFLHFLPGRAWPGPGIPAQPSSAPRSLASRESDSRAPAQIVHRRRRQECAHKSTSLLIPPCPPGPGPAGANPGSQKMSESQKSKIA